MPVFKDGHFKTFTRLHHDIPYDVSFEIGDATDKSRREEEMIIKGHKFLLSAFSPVFSRMFYGPLRETRNPIPIEDTTVRAFKSLINLVYQVDVEWLNSSWEDFFDVVYLVEKYQMTDIMNNMKDLVVEYIITSDNEMIDLAQSASKFAHLTQIYPLVVENCANYLRGSRCSSASFGKLARDLESRGKKETIFSQIFYRAICIEADWCENCCLRTDFCRNRCSVNWQDLRVGLRISLNGDICTVVDFAKKERYIELRKHVFPFSDEFFNIRFKDTKCDEFWCRETPAQILFNCD